MRLLVHRGQALLLLIVGGLAAAVVVAAGLEQSGVLSPVATRAAEVVAPHRSQVPAHIEIGSQGQTPIAGGGLASAPAGPTSVIAEGQPSAGVGVAATQPSPGPTTTVVPPTVYAYPADDHGGSGRPDGGSSGGTGGGGSGSGSGGGTSGGSKGGDPHP